MPKAAHPLTEMMNAIKGGLHTHTHTRRQLLLRTFTVESVLHSFRQRASLCQLLLPSSLHPLTWKKFVHKLFDEILV